MDMELNEEIKGLIQQQGDAIASFRKHVDDSITNERKEREALEARLNRGGVRSGIESGHGVPLSALNAPLRESIKAGDMAPLHEFYESKAMSVASDPDGGFTVYPELSAKITEKVFETSPFRPLARVVKIGSDALEELVDLTEPDAGWVSEIGSRDDTSTPTVGKARIPVHEIYAQPKVTQKLLDDSNIDIGAWLVAKIGKKFSRTETAAFFTGTGSGQPRGFLTYTSAATSDASRDWGVIEHLPTGVDGDFAASHKGDKLIDLQALLKADYLANAVWLMNRRTAAIIRKFKDGQSNYLWERSTQAGQPNMLLGHPVVLCEDMPDIASDSYSVAFGDFQEGYTIVDRFGERIMPDPYTGKPYVKFYATRRVGGDVTNFESIKLLKFATS
jgi:HK97 family phage major capsid protein